ncbi:MAG: SRPBCC family protein [Mangrovibacterium sp.]
MKTTKITVETTVKAPVEKVWETYTSPKHIVKWNSASDDWHTPKAENDLRTGGRFLSRMEARDSSAGFDFEGVYDEVKRNELIAYSMADGRKAEIIFTAENNETGMKIVFDAETENPVEMQREGWQAILDNFKKYTEAS